MKEIYPVGMASSMTSIFKLMEIAEEEIAKAQERHPECKDEIWHSFLSCKPTLNFSDYAAWIYRAHCREILERVATKKLKSSEFSMATWAELVIEISEASMIAAFSEGGVKVYAYVLSKIQEVLGDEYPEEAKTIQKLVTEIADEPWPGFAAEEANRLRRQRNFERALPNIPKYEQKKFL